LFLNANQEMNASQSLKRGLKIFELLDGSTTSLGVREIARRLDLSTTIAQRLVNTLATHSYLEQISETRRYRIGPRAVGLGSSVIAALSVAFPEGTAPEDDVHSVMRLVLDSTTKLSRGLGCRASFLTMEGCDLDAA
jgi:DNA-binding IclR family transcriptional regulator